MSTAIERALVLHCCECDAKMDESESYQFRGPLSFACEKCIRDHYGNHLSSLELELKERKYSAIQSIKRNRKTLEKIADKRAEREANR